MAGGYYFSPIQSTIKDQWLEKLMRDEEQEFICPECGSKNADVAMMISPNMPDSPDYDENDPWNEVLQTIQCGVCDSTIPAHLAERRDGLSYKDAQQEWRNVYRENQA